MIHSDENCTPNKNVGVKCTDPPYKDIPIATGPVKLPSTPSGVSRNQLPIPAVSHYM